MTTPHERLTTALRRAETRCHRDGYSFPDMLREALEAVAVGLGGTDELVRTRPGSWEAGHLRDLAMAADWTIDETAHLAKLDRATLETPTEGARP